jgi:anti-sigma factor RsiW
MKDHIPVSQLALYSTGDLGWWKHRRAEAHLTHCDECSELAAAFRAQQDTLSEYGNALPPGVSEAAWKSLSSEMTANIRLGLAAGECVAPRYEFTSRPRLALTLAGLAVVMLIAGLQRPVADASHESLAIPSTAGTLESNAAGVELRSGNRMLRVSVPDDREVIRTVSTRGEIRSRYVDDSGVTIVNVSAE